MLIHDMNFTIVFAKIIIDARDGVRFYSNRPVGVAPALMGRFNRSVDYTILVCGFTRFILDMFGWLFLIGQWLNSTGPIQAQFLT
jgi:hypothetical protein